VDPSQHNIIFVDTEFTAFHNPQLISMGCVRLNEQFELAERFYVEAQFDERCASHWVCEYVIPKLTMFRLPAPNCARRLADWLKKLPHSESIVCFDFQYDWDFVGAMLSPAYGDLLAKLAPRNVREEAADTRALIPDWDHRVHHALRDAEHLARGWRIHHELHMKDRHG
jgi:hypothetical protein